MAGMSEWAWSPSPFFVFRLAVTGAALPFGASLIASDTAVSARFSLVTSLAASDRRARYSAPADGNRRGDRRKR